MFNNNKSKASLYSMERVSKKKRKKDDDGKELFTSFGEIDNSVNPNNFSFGESDKEDDSINNNDIIQKKTHQIFDNKLKNNTLNTRSNQKFSFEYSEEKKKIKEYKPKNFNSSFEIYIIGKNEIINFKKFLFQKFPLFYKKRTNTTKKKTIEVKKISQFNKYSNRFKLTIGCYCEREPTKNILKGRYLIHELLDESTFSYIYSITEYKSSNNKKQYIAKKIKNSNFSYFDQSVYEIYILSYLKKRGNCQKYNILEIFDYFYYNVI